MTRSTSFEFRPLAEGDLPRLLDWLNRPHLLEWWGGETTLEQVRQKYLPRMAGADDARPFLAFVDGAAVGFIQYYDAAAGDPNWWPDDPGPGVIGIDMYIADPDRLSRGLGTAMARQFAAKLFRELGATEIRVDPRPDNARAIRCYEKAGFRKVGPITNPDGPAIMMVLEPKSLRD